MSFHNTTGEVGPGLALAEEKALTQEERVLKFFHGLHFGAALSPEQVWRKCFGSRTPPQSIRRAMTNMATAGILVRTGNTVPGDYGKRVGTYTLAPESAQTNLFHKAA